MLARKGLSFTFAAIALTTACARSTPVGPGEDIPSVAAGRPDVGAVDAWRADANDQTREALARAFFPWLWKDAASGSDLPMGAGDDRALRVEFGDDAGLLEITTRGRTFRVRHDGVASKSPARIAATAAWLTEDRFLAPVGLRKTEDSGWIADQVEEFAVVAEASGEHRARYEVEVPPGIVSVVDARESLEFVDARGRALLRFVYPVARDAAGVLRKGEVRLRGVASEKHGRFALRDSHVTIEVKTRLAGLAAPVVVDPAWQSTASIGVALLDHTATALPDGRVLVAGGFSDPCGGFCPTYYSDFRTFDPDLGTWQFLAAAGLPSGRRGHVAVRLPTGQMLIAGGQTYDGPDAGSSPDTLDDAYLVTPDASSGGFDVVTLPPMNGRREFATGNLVFSGSSARVLVTGGRDNTGGVAILTPDADLFDVASRTWSVTGPRAFSSWGHSSAVLPGGRVLVAAGCVIGSLNDGCTNTTTSAETYNPATNSWVGTAVVTSGQVFATMTVVPSGKALVAGGRNMGGSALTASQLFDPSGPSWSAVVNMNAARSEHAGVRLPSGQVLVTGGMNGGVPQSSSETFLEGSGWSLDAPAMGTPRARHTASILPSGGVLVAGGLQTPIFATDTAEIYRREGTNAATGAMSAARVGHTATLLGDGRVFIVGGAPSDGAAPIASTAFYTSSGSFAAGPPLGTARTDHETILLPSGKVLVTGGVINGAGAITATTEIWDPETNVWTAGPDMTSPRREHAIVQFEQSFQTRYLLIGGRAAGMGALATTEVYDPIANTFTPGPSLSQARRQHTATYSRSNGGFGPTELILVSGGRKDIGDANILASTEILNVSEGFFRPGPSLDVFGCGGMTEHRAVALGDGRVLLSGGFLDAALCGPVATWSIAFDPASQTIGNVAFFPGPSPLAGHAASLLPGGTVLIAGGTDGSSPVRHLMTYDPASNQWLWQNPTELGTARVGATATLLANGNVLIAGGADSLGAGLASAELFNEIGTDAGRPTVTAPAVVPSGPFHVNGTGFTTSELGDGTTRSSSAGYGRPTLIFANGSTERLNEGGITSTGLDVIQEPNSNSPEGYGLLFVSVGGVPGGRVVFAGGEDGGSPFIETQDITVAEAIGNATFRLRLTKPATQSVSVTYQTVEGTATSGTGGDFTATSGTVTIPSGNLSALVSVPILNDTRDEPDGQYFTLEFTSIVGAIAINEPRASITDDDALPSLSIAGASVAEGNFGASPALDFVVSLSNPSDSPVTVLFQTSNGTAASGEDYGAAQGTLTFVPGATSQTVRVFATGDTYVEPSETFVTRLSGAVSATIGTATGTGTLTNDDVNVAPVALPDSAAGPEDQMLSIAASDLLLNDSDANFDALSITGVGGGVNGTPSGPSAGIITFTPTSNFVGTASFTYTVSDGSLSSVGTVTVSVTSVNDAPVAIADSHTATEDTPTTFPSSDLVTNDTDADSPIPGDSLQVTAVGSPANGTATLAAVGGNITYRANANFNGTDSYTYTVRDNSGATSTGTVTVTVNPVNDAPSVSIVQIAPNPAPENSLVTVTFRGSDPIDAGSTGAYCLDITWGDGSPVQPVVSLALDTDVAVSHTYTDNLSANLFVVVRDLVNTGTCTTTAGSLFGTASQAVVVENVAPTITNVAQSPANPTEGDSVTITVTASDVAAGNDPLQYSFDFTNDGVFDVTNQVASSSANTYNQNGVYSVRVRVIDQDGGSVEAIKVVTVSDDAPAISGVTNSSPASEGASVTVTVTATDTGTDPLEYQFDWDNNGTYDEVQSSPTAGHVFQDNGSFLVPVKVTDNAGSSATSSTTVTVTNVAPTFPVVANQTATEGLLFQLAPSATDPAGASDPLVWSFTASPPGMSIGPSTGVITWVPTYTQSDDAPGQVHTVTVQVADGDTGTASRTFTVSVLYQDNDGDGMADTWEVGNGLDPTVNDATGDADGDGIRNLDEYRMDNQGYAPPAQVAAVSPLDGQQSLLQDPVLDFTDATIGTNPLATRPYQLQVFDEAMVNLVLDTEPSVPSNLSVSTIVLDDTTVGNDAGNPSNVDLTDDDVYVWRVRAIDNAGGRGLWSIPVRFQYNPTNDPPTAPVHQAPVAGEVVGILRPELVVSNSTDPDALAPLVYDFEVYANATCTGAPVATSPNTPQGASGTTKFALTADLADDTVYCWRVFADDGTSTTGSGNRTFTVNTANNEPTVPGLNAPADGSVVSTSTVTLIVDNATDADGDALEYWFELDTTPTFVGADYQALPAVPEGVATTSLVSAALVEDASYWWRVRASDGYSLGDWVLGTFFVSTADDAPSAPVALNPIDGTTVNSEAPELSVQNAVDPEGDAITYAFEVRANAADGEVVASTTGVAEGPGGRTSWIVDPPLKKGVIYVWTASATSGALSTSIAAPESFFTYKVPKVATGCSVGGEAGPVAGGLVGFVALTAMLVRRRRRP